MRRRLVGGEILEVPVGDRFGYVQFLGVHPDYGDAVLVNPALHDRQGRFASDFFSTGYVTFYPAAEAVASKKVEVVAQSSPPKLPKRFRRAKERDGAVESWVIEGGWRKVVKETLSDEERRLPIASVWKHEHLRAQIASGWTPETDVASGR
ncbi:MAG TPA: hypothetical protein VIV63_04170 [Steroidobacteraceae bacterium]